MYLEYIRVVQIEKEKIWVFNAEILYIKLPSWTSFSFLCWFSPMVLFCFIFLECSLLSCHDCHRCAFIFGCSFQFYALIFIFDYNFAIDVFQQGHVTIHFLKILYIMRYNLKNAKNGKSISKIPKWPSLMSLALKSKLISPFDFFRKSHLWKICGRVRPCTPATFFIQIFLVFLKFKSS